MKKVLIVLISIIFFGCTGRSEKFICKSEESNSYKTSLKIDGKKMILGNQVYKYCESIGNQDVYHNTCIKNEYGNYESSVKFDSILKKIVIVGSGGMLPIELLNCQKVD
jgi:hypothetical protein